MSVYKYAYYCITESAWFVSYGLNPPTLCVNNTAHVINTSATSVSEISNAAVIAVQSELIPTQGYFRVQGYNFTATAGPSVTTTYTFSFPYPITVLNFTSLQTAAQFGDFVNVYTAPNTNIGPITSNVSIGDTTIFVAQTVMNMIRMGFLVSLSDGINTQSMGQCISLKANTNSITLSVASTFSFLVSTPTYVIITILRISDYLINLVGPITLGDKNLVGSYLPTDVIVSVLYTNMSSGPQNVNFILEYLY